MPASLDDINTQLKLSNQNMSQLIQAIMKGLAAFSNQNAGTFTMTAAATAIVPLSAVTASSSVFLMPTNAAAATLMGSAKSLYVSALTAGSSFTVTTGNGTNAAGGEQFSYTCLNF